jgi:hypothetical protein
VAAETGFYNIPDGMGGVSPEVEHGLANVESMTVSVFRAIDASGIPPGVRDADSATLALFVGLQAARTTHNRESALFPQQVLAWAAGRPLTHELMAEYLETEYLGFTPHDREIDAALTYVQVAQGAPETLTQEWAVEMMLRSALEFSKQVLRLHWSIEHDRRREFITSDTPVVLWRKPSHQDEYRGLGISTAAEVRIPLDPGKQLVMSRRPRRPSHDVAVHRVRRSNADMAAACHRLIVGAPTNREVGAHRLDRLRPPLRFMVGPGVEVGPDGIERPMRGDILQAWAPRSSRVGRPRRRASE